MGQETSTPAIEQETQEYSEVYKTPVDDLPPSKMVAENNGTSTAMTDQPLDKVEDNLVPPSPGEYEIDWSAIDETFDPFGPPPVTGSATKAVTNPASGKVGDAPEEKLPTLANLSVSKQPTSPTDRENSAPPPNEDKTSDVKTEDPSPKLDDEDSKTEPEKSPETIGATQKPKPTLPVKVPSMTGNESPSVRTPKSAGVNLDAIDWDSLGPDSDPFAEAPKASAMPEKPLDPPKVITKPTKKQESQDLKKVRNEEVPATTVTLEKPPNKSAQPGVKSLAPNEPSPMPSKPAQPREKVAPSVTEKKEDVEAELDELPSPGAYKIDWDTFDESAFDPFGSSGSQPPPLPNKTLPLKENVTDGNSAEKPINGNTGGQKQSSELEQKSDAQTSKPSTVKQPKAQTAQQKPKPVGPVKPLKASGTSTPEVETPINAGIELDSIDWDNLGPGSDPFARAEKVKVLDPGDSSGSTSTTPQNSTPAKAMKKPTGDDTENKTAPVNKSDEEKPLKRTPKQVKPDQSKVVGSKKPNPPAAPTPTPIKPAELKDKPVQLVKTSQQQENDDLQSSAPPSPGAYNIDWSTFDESSFNPFGTSEPLPSVPPMQKKPAVPKQAETDGMKNKNSNADEVKESTTKMDETTAAVEPSSKPKTVLNRPKKPVQRPKPVKRETKGPEIDSKSPNVAIKKGIDKDGLMDSDSTMDDRTLDTYGGYDLDFDNLDAMSDPFGKSSAKLQTNPPARVNSQGDGPVDMNKTPTARTPVRTGVLAPKPTPIPNGNGTVRPGPDSAYNGPSPHELAEALEQVAMLGEFDSSPAHQPKNNSSPNHPADHSLQRIDSSTRPASPTQSSVLSAATATLLPSGMTDLASPVGRPSADSTTSNHPSPDQSGGGGGGGAQETVNLTRVAPVTETEVAALRRERDELVKTADEMRRCISEYDRSLQHLIEEKSQGDSAPLNISLVDIITERDQAVEEVATIEKAFGDLHRRFEKSKQVIESYKQNEEALKHSIDEYKSLLERQENKYMALKKYAEDKLLMVTQDSESIKSETENSMSRLQTSLRMLELQNQSLESQLEQKKRENAELTKICEELLSKYSST